MMDLRRQRALVLGLAREGVSLARFLAHRGAAVTVTDRRSEKELAEARDALSDLRIQFRLGSDYVELVGEADVLYVSPGVPESNPVYVAARAAAIPIQSMTTLFFELCRAPIVGVTGSSGKTTTTGLIGSLLCAGGRNALVGGNIGDPMLDLLPLIDDGAIVVLELSSFQLLLLRRSPHVAVVTNISPNHLDRHGTMEEYVAAKRHILLHQSAGDIAILNADDDCAAAFARATPAEVRYFGFANGIARGATVRDGIIGLLTVDGFDPIMPEADVPLLGRHNVANVLAAAAAAHAFGVDPTAIAEGVGRYRPAPHRLQIIGERQGVRYIDDSIATSPARALVALQAIQAPLILIAGGRDKYLPWEEFASLVALKVKAVLLIGEAASLIDEALRRQLQPSGQLHADAIYRCATIEQAVSEASRLAQPGDVVLLSPGCTSYDMFRDFEERGDAFARAVEMLDVA